MSIFSLFGLGHNEGSTDRKNSNTKSARHGMGRRGVARVLALSCVLTFAGFAASTSVPKAAAVPPPFPIVDNTTGPAGTTNYNWQYRTNGAGGNTPDQYTRDGWLRLTSNAQSLSTNILKDVAFPSTEGFQVSFDYRQAGGSSVQGSTGTYRTGDGIAMYLIDGTNSISASAPGAGLGYACGGSGNPATGTNCAQAGVLGGYLGLGLDVFGNYASRDFGSGGPTPALTSWTGGIGLRGSGNGTNPSTYSQRYPWVTGVPMDLWTGITNDTRDPATYDSNYRRVTITVAPSGTSLKITVAMSALAVKTAAPGPMTQVFQVDNLNGVSGQVPLPATLKLGFSASTGAATDYHDIRNVRVSALTDTAITKTLSTDTPGHAGYPAGTFLPGDPISFTLTATNNGPTDIGSAPDGVARVYDDLSGLPIKDVSWTCDASGGAACENGSGGSGSVVSQDWTGAKGSSVTVTVSGTVTSTPGNFTNTAILPTDFDKNVVDVDNPLAQKDGGAIDTNTDNNTATADFTVVTPALTLVKTATVGGVPTTDLVAGQTVTYEFEVTNTAQTALNEIAINETSFSGTGTLPTPSCPVTSLDPGASTTCTVDYTVTQKDVDAGTLTNTATAQGTAPGETTPTVSDPSSAELTATANPALTLVKTANENGVPTEDLSLGQIIDYTFTVTNTGNVTMSGIHVDEASFDGSASMGSITCPSDTLEPKQSVICTAPAYTVSQKDVDQGSLTNTAYAYGTAPGATDETQSDLGSAKLSSDQAPALKLTKTGELATGVTPPKAGDIVDFTILVKNEGNVSLHSFDLTDDMTGLSALTYTWPATVDVLAPGDAMKATATYTLTSDDINRGSVENAASVTALDPADNSVGDDDTATVTWDNKAAITLEKTGALASGAAGNVGDIITYTFKATNTGNLPLTGVKITDPLLGSTPITYTWPAGETAGTLKPGEVVTGTATYTVTQTDVDNGLVHNKATATGTPPSGSDVTDTAETDVPLVASHPGLKVTKTDDTSKFGVPVQAGNPIGYTVEVSNSGNVTLTNVTVNDPLLGGDITAKCGWPAGSVGKLIPGQAVTCTGSYPLTQKDVDAGTVKNTATATGYGPDGTKVTGDGSVTTDLTKTTDYGPGLKTVKTDDVFKLPVPVKVGDKVGYTITSTNTGDLTLTGVTVTDPLLGGDITSSCTWDGTASVLLPGQAVTCTGTYLLKQSDIDAGMVKNTATATGYDPDGSDVTDGDTVTTELPPAPSISLIKTGLLTTSPGDTVRFGFEATNDGNVTLTGVSIADHLTGVSSIIYTWPDSSKPGVLTPEQSVTGEATYKLSQTDIDAGHVANTATVTGTPPDGPNVTGDGNTDVKIPAAGGLTIDKTATGPDGNVITELVKGNTIGYSFLVTNTGNVTLSGVTVDDSDFTGTGTMTDIDCPATVLAPGKSMTCTASYVITQDDVDAGDVTNTATATGTPPDPDQPPVVSPPDTVTVPGDMEPGLKVTKTDDTSKFGVPVQAGNPIGYTVEVSNSGNVTLTNVTVNDPLLGGDITSKCNWPAGSVGKLVPSQKVSCDVSYPLTQTDIDKGKVLNTATATGYGPDGTKVTGDGSVTTDLTKTTGYGPGLKTVKTADKSGLSDPVQVNDPIVYTVKSTNTGDLTLTGVTVSDKLANGHVVALSCTWPGVAGTLLPGQTVTCTGTYLLTQPDIDAGEVTNTGHAEGTPPSTPDNPNPTPIPGDDTIITNVPSDPSISLTKTGSLTTSPAKAGDTVRFGFEATNDGNVTLTNVSVADKLAGVSSITYTWPDSSKPGVLAPGQTVTGVATYKLTQTDVDAGHVANTATVTGTPPNGPNVTGDGDTDVKIPAAGGLSVKKIALGADDSTITELVEGNTIDYSFVVTNTGNVTISGVSINDTDFTGTGTMSSIICPSTALAPGKSAICTATYVITQDDVDAGTLSNTATATGTPPDPDQPPVDSPPDTIIVPGDMEPGLQVVKSYDISGFSSPVFAGDPIDYTVDVTNSGNVTLTDVTVVDPLLGGDITGDCVWPDTQGKLNPGQQASCEMAYPLTQADVDKGKVLNTATATGHDSDGTEVSDEDSVTTDLTVTPGYGPDLTVAKNDDTSGLSSPAEIDDPIVYTVTAANTGDLTLTGVTVTDELLGGDITASCTWPGKAGVLLPKQVVTCGGTYLVTQVDIDAGKVSNTALAHGTPPSTPDNPNPTPIPGDDTIITNVPSDPSISLTKTGSLTTSPAKAGDTVKFSFEAANDGNVTLTNVSVADKLAGVSSITYTWPDSSKPGVLAPGESVTGEATYKLTQANVDAGHVANTATATGTPPDGPNVTGDGDTDVKIPAAGGLSMKKIASGEDGNPVSKLVAGDTINYSFVVTNSGNVTISSVSINDTDFTGTGTITGIVCPSTALAPGKSMTCTASYVITQDDVDAGTLSNTATATGTPPDPDQPPVDSPPDTVTVPSDPEPSLSLNKTGALAAGATGVAGDIVEYAFTATNTGNTTLENVSISDQMVGLSNITYTWPSAEGVLTPGQQVTATATYTLTQKDVDAGGVHNLAIVTDTTPPDDGCTDQTTCGSDSTDVPVTAHPALDLVKTDSVNGGPATDLVVGQVIDYKFKVTNTGNVTMSNINIVEQTFTGSGLMSGITCPANTLAPGGSMYCTATYKVRQADVDAGQVKNTAVAVGTPPALQTDPSTGNLVLGNCPTCTVTVQKPMTSNQSTAIAFMDPDSGLSMVKTANVSTYTAGTVITYTFTVTNTGDVSLSGVSVVEGVFNGSGRLSNVTCPATATLAPGQVLVCTATYTATAADVANGKLSNAATATGVPPTNDVTPPSKTQSPPSTVTIVAKPVVVQTGGTLAASAGAALPLGLVIAGLLTFVASLLFTTKAGEGRRYMRRR